MQGFCRVTKFKGRTKALMITVAVVFAISIFSIGTYHYDKAMAADGKEPEFVIHMAVINDGGSKVYYGLGYQIIMWNQLTSDSQTKLKDTETHFLFDIVNPLDGPAIRLTPEKEVD